jgi:hypothetical protein
MITFIQKLPQDIMYHIIPYTYQLQPNVIMNDIKNYKETKELIVSLYYNYWIVNFEEAEPEDKYWLINDLVLLINNDQATMNGYVENFYNIFRRNQCLQSCESINNYVSNLETKPVTTQINIIWSLLTPKERTEFLVSFQESIQIFI